MSSPFDKDWVAPEPKPVAEKVAAKEFFDPETGEIKTRAPATAKDSVLSDHVARHVASHRPDIDLALRVKVNPEVPRSGWGLYTDIDAVDYHLDPCPEPSISNSLMPPILTQTPRDFAWSHPRRNELVPTMPVEPDIRKTTAAKVRGDIVHQLALGKGRGIAIGDFKDWRTDKAKAFRDAAEADGLTAIKRADYDEAVPLAAMIKERIKRALDGADYVTEVVGMYQEQTQHGPVWVRLMIDVWCAERCVIIDPKVTSRLYDGLVEKHALAMGWDRQSALYTHALAKIIPDTAGRLEFWDLMINPDAPHVSRLWAPEKAWEASSVRQCQLAIDRFAECMWTKKWPGFSKWRARGPMPPWEDKRREQQELGA